MFVFDTGIDDGNYRSNIFWVIYPCTRIYPILRLIGITLKHPPPYTKSYRNGPEGFVRLDGHLHLILVHDKVQVLIFAGLEHGDLDVEGSLSLCPAVAVALTLHRQVFELVPELCEPVYVFLALPRVALLCPFVILSFQPLQLVFERTKHGGKWKKKARGKRLSAWYMNQHVSRNCCQPAVTAQKCGK